MANYSINGAGIFSLCDLIELTSCLDSGTGLAISIGYITCYSLTGHLCFYVKLYSRNTVDVTWSEQTASWFDSDVLQPQHRNYFHTHTVVLIRSFKRDQETDL